MDEIADGRVIWFTDNEISGPFKITGAIIGEKDLKFDCVINPTLPNPPRCSVRLTSGNSMWHGTVSPGNFDVGCNLYRDGDRLALVGIDKTDWIEQGREWRWVAEFKISNHPVNLSPPDTLNR
jgi:hypothetical protein